MELKRLEPDDPRPPFSCGDPDIDEFFSADSRVGGQELLCVTYAFMNPETGEVVGFFSVSNDSIKKEDVPNSARKRWLRRVPHEKQYSSMPTAKIGRLGVSLVAQKSGVGTKILDFLKAWFTHENKTGCRFLVVDAYKKNEILNFYKKNGFEFLSSEDAGESTRIMYFDLKTFRP